MKSRGVLVLVVGLSCLVGEARLDTPAKPEGEAGGDKGNASKSNKESVKATKLPPCAACRVLTDSFKKGIESTARGKYEGGDSAWEEQKKLSYKTSEVRLIEIQEKLCKDVERGQKQCESSAEEHEGELEDWWFREQDEEEDVHSWLCVVTLRVCCPPNHYGPQCLPCKGGTEAPCGGNGKCKGAGTRKGSGECACNPGYEGDLCDACTYGYFQAYRDNTKNLCEKCHKACNGPCSGPGQKSCVACHEGWVMDTEKGCLDVNECLAAVPPCQRSQFCINNEGAYTCLECDKSCDGCHGDGPDMCEKCAEGFILEKDMCVDEDTIEERGEEVVVAMKEEEEEAMKEEEKEEAMKEEEEEVVATKEEEVVATKEEEKEEAMKEEEEVAVATKEEEEEETRKTETREEGEEASVTQAREEL